MDLRRSSSRRQSDRREREFPPGGAAQPRRPTSVGSEWGVRGGLSSAPRGRPTAEVAVAAYNDAVLGGDGRGPLADAGAGAGAAGEEDLAAVAVDAGQLAVVHVPDDRLALAVGGGGD